MISLATPLIAMVMMFTILPAQSAEAEPLAIMEIELGSSTPITYDTEILRLSEKYNFNVELARKIIECESLVYGQNAENKNYRDEWDGSLMATSSVHWSSDIGYWQINDYWHKEDALKIGYDIYNWKDNLEYGAILLSRDGTRHWNASKYCWNK